MASRHIYVPLVPSAALPAALSHALGVPAWPWRSPVVTGPQLSWYVARRVMLVP